MKKKVKREMDAASAHSSDEDSTRDDLVKKTAPDTITATKVTEVSSSEPAGQSSYASSSAASDSGHNNSATKTSSSSDSESSKKSNTENNSKPAAIASASAITTSATTSTSPPFDYVHKGGGRIRLPDKLMEYLSKEVLPDTLWWQPDGDGFAFDTEKIQTNFLDKHFRGTKLTSFIRSLNRWYVDR